jgi:hypothetical protein
MKSNLAAAIAQGKKVLASAGSLKYAIKSLIDLSDNIEKYPFYELTKEDKSTLVATTILLIALHESIYGENDEG